MEKGLEKGIAISLFMAFKECYQVTKRSKTHFVGDLMYMNDHIRSFTR